MVNKLFSSILFLSCASMMSADAAHPSSDWEDYVPSEWQGYLPKQVADSTHYGPTEITDEHFQDLTVYGHATITDSVSNGSVIVKGGLKVCDSALNEVDVDGMTEIDDSKVNGLCIRGPIFAKDSVISNVEVYSKETYFSNSLVNQLVVKENNKKEHPRVFLKNTTVDSITFEGKKGTVVVDSSSRVNNLTGGKLVQK